MKKVMSSKGVNNFTARNFWQYGKMYMKQRCDQRATIPGLT